MTKFQDGCRVPTGNLWMLAGSYYIPKKNELRPRGEDAHFISSESQTFGIADGVGSWKKHGIDSGEYSRQLMNNASRFSICKRGTSVDPVKVLSGAFFETRAKGSSTACILTVKDDRLHAVNVGDSGFLHIRGERIIYRSPVQVKGFNRPYQLGWFKKNDLKLADKIKRLLAPGDVIVAGTDGLFDNVHDEEMEELVKNGRLENYRTPTLLARNIACFALEKAKDRRARTPFAEQRRMAGEEDAVGGKYDDITVVVAYILPSPFKNKLEKKEGYRNKKIQWRIGKFWWQFLEEMATGRGLLGIPKFLVHRSSKHRTIHHPID